MNITKKLFNRLKTKTAAVGSTEIVIIILVTVVIAIASGLAIKSILGNENSGIIGSISNRIADAPEQINGTSGSGLSGGSGGGDVQGDVANYGTVTKSWDVSEAQDGSVTMDYYDDTKTAVVSGSGEILDNLAIFLTGFDLSRINDGEYMEEFFSTHTDENGNGIPDYPAETVIFDDTVTRVGYQAFYGNPYLTSVTIGNGVTEISSSALGNCENLTSITIGNSVTTIGEFAFQYCTSLTSIEIPNSVTTIDNYAFDQCTSLTSITIPDSVTSIGWGAFSGCENLTDVYYSGTEAQWNSISIGNNNNQALTNATIHYNS